MELNPESRAARAKNKLRRVLTLASRPHGRQRVIVSLTSYPARIEYVSRVVRSVFAQRTLPDLTVLYLSRDQFPSGEEGLPKELLDCRGSDFRIQWVSGDMRSHKKYLYSTRQFADDLVITIDDDIICRNTLVEELLEGHEKHPHCVVAIRAHRIKFDPAGRMLPYGSWDMEVGNTLPGLCDVPRRSLFATSGAGLLLPSCSLPDAAFDERAILATCPNADDVWLKAMTTLAGYPTVTLPGWQGVDCIEGSQETSLWESNSQGGNDDAISRVRVHCERDLGVESFDGLFLDEDC